MLSHGNVCSRRLFRQIGADVAEAARHTDAVWPDEILVVVVTRVGVVADRVPCFLRRFVEVGVWKETQSDNPGRKPVIGTDWHASSARADFDAWVFLRVLERIWWASVTTPVGPKAKRVGVLAAR